MALLIKEIPYTQSELKEMFDYNGFNLIYKKVRSRHTRVGDVPGCVNNAGYRVTGIHGRLYKNHRLIYKWYYGVDPLYVDHINRDKTDNRIDNLSSGTMEDNGRNRSISKNNKSGINGVCWRKDKKKWQVNIHYHGRIKNIGWFDDLSEARQSRVNAEHEYWGKTHRNL